MIRWFGKQKDAGGKPDGETKGTADPQPRAMPATWTPTLPAVPNPPPAAAPVRLAPPPPPAVTPPPSVAGLPPPPAASLPSPPKTPAPREQQQKTLYKQLMNGFYDAILIADSKGHIVEGNVRAPEFFGFSNEELWDMAAAKLIAGLNESVYERIRRAIGGERYVLMNTRCTRKDGTHFPAEVGISVVAMLGKEDFVFTVRNIERRAAQLRNLRAGHNAFMNAQAGCFICDASRRVVTANNAFLTILRLASSVPVAGVSIDQFLPAVGEYFTRVASGESLVLRCAGSADGVEIPLVVSLAPNRQGTSQIDGIVGSLIPEQPEA